MFYMVACGSKHDSPKSAPDNHGIPKAHVDGRSCNNPIILDDPTLSPLTRYTDLPKGEFKLSKIQMFTLAEHKNEFFLASASDSNNFTVSIDCSEIHGSNDLADTVRSSDFINTQTLTSTNERTIEVKFQKTNLVLAHSQLISDTSVT